MSTNDVVTGELVAADTTTLFRTDDPVGVIPAAQRIADALKTVLDEGGMTMKIGKSEHVLIDGWQTLGAMLGVSPHVVWSRPLDDGRGWEARAEAKTVDGRVVGSAEAMVTRDERNWRNGDDYALRSMAQTRAMSKALRGPLGFVIGIAGRNPTPAEEMPTDAVQAPEGTVVAVVPNWAHDIPEDAVDRFGRNLESLLQDAGAARPARRRRRHRRAARQLLPRHVIPACCAAAAATGRAGHHNRRPPGAAPGRRRRHCPTRPRRTYPLRRDPMTTFAERWKKAGEDQVEDWDPDDGPYTVQIVEADAFNSRDGREFSKVKLRVVEGEHAGKQFEDFNGYENEVGARIARANLSVYGLNVDEVEDFEDLAIRIGELVGNRAEVTVKHCKGFLNVTAQRGFPTNGQPDVPADLTDFKPAAAGTRTTTSRSDRRAGGTRWPPRVVDALQGAPRLRRSCPTAATAATACSCGGSPSSQQRPAGPAKAAATREQAGRRRCSTSATSRPALADLRPSATARRRATAATRSAWATRRSRRSR